MHTFLLSSNAATSLVICCSSIGGNDVMSRRSKEPESEREALSWYERAPVNCACTMKAAESTFDYDNAPTIFDPATLLRKGRCIVSKTRTPVQHELYFEIHGSREQTKPVRRLVFIMGLSNSCFGWNNQVEHFTKHASDSNKEFGSCQVLVFDNRGVGLSDSPKGAYKTSEMAKDAIELLQFIGWLPGQDGVVQEPGTTSDGGINVIGVSMGGMIALELVSNGASLHMAAGDSHGPHRCNERFRTSHACTECCRQP